MLAAAPAAQQILLSTPAGASGEFHRAWSSGEDWERVQITADQCPRISATHLAGERIRLYRVGNCHELVPEYRIVNRGISGDTSSGVLDRLQEVIERRPKVVFVMVGTNDISREVPPRVLLRNLREIVTRLREASITVVAQSILLRGGWQQASNDTIAAVNSEWAAFCATQGVPFLDLNALMAVNSSLPDAMTYDGVHLTAAAYRVWRDAVVRTAADILPELAL